MDVHIEELSSSLRVTDTEALLTPQLIKRIVAEVLARVAEDDRLKSRLDRDTRLTRGAIDPPERVA
ncbi:MAG: hypothetical protein GC191_00920 [Azospirillum sp.]|nr:hypothetical protein [Azospirillum sp.]